VKTVSLCRASICRKLYLKFQKIEQGDVTRTQFLHSAQRNAFIISSFFKSKSDSVNNSYLWISPFSCFRRQKSKNSIVFREKTVGVNLREKRPVANSAAKSTGVVGSSALVMALTSKEQTPPTAHAPPSPLKRTLPSANFQIFLCLSN